MMTMNKYIWMAALVGGLASTLTACSSDNDEPVQQEQEA